MTKDLRLALIFIGLIIILFVIVHDMWSIYKNRILIFLKRKILSDKKKFFFNQKSEIKLHELEKLIGEIYLTRFFTKKNDFNILKTIKNDLLNKVKNRYLNYFLTKQKNKNKNFNKGKLFHLKKLFFNFFFDKFKNKKIIPINFFSLNSLKEENNRRNKTFQFHTKEKLNLLTLHVINYKSGNLLDNRKLFKGILKIGFQFGKMNIFHRHLTSYGNGPILFSLANIVKPGYFDFNKIYNFNTFGISIFMILPSVYGDSYQNFKFMLQSAQYIADECNGIVLDNERNMITPQKLEEYKLIIKQTIKNNSDKI